MVLAETDPQAVIRRAVANEAQRILRRRSSKSLILYDSDADDDEKDHDQHDDHDRGDVDHDDDHLFLFAPLPSLCSRPHLCLAIA